MAVGICLLSASSLKAQNAKSDFRWPQGKRVAVSFSFDDARLSQIDVGTPLLDKYGVKATFYVSPRSVEKRLDGWKKAVASGHEIGNHSLTHPCTVNFGFSQQNALENYTIPMMEAQLDDANAEIQRMLGVKPVTFAYPCGQKFIGRGAGVQSYVPLVAKRFLAGRGFRDEMSNVPAACDLAQVLGTDSDGLTFEQMRDLVVTASKQGRWVAFAGHEIGKPGRQVTLAAALEQFLQYAKDPANGVWLDTVQAVAKHIQAQRGAR
jgi:peptidoglycan/xylan/chitin deacetylase (PgdA/CDA1 family)